MNQIQIEKIKKEIESSGILTAREKDEWLQLLEMMSEKQLLELDKILNFAEEDAKRYKNKNQVLPGQPGKGPEQQTRPVPSPKFQLEIASAPEEKLISPPAKIKNEPAVAAPTVQAPSKVVANTPSATPTTVLPKVAEPEKAKPLFSHILNLPKLGAVKPVTEAPKSILKNTDDSNLKEMGKPKENKFGKFLKNILLEKELPPPKKQEVMPLKVVENKTSEAVSKILPPIKPSVVQKPVAALLGPAKLPEKIIEKQKIQEPLLSKTDPVKPLLEQISKQKEPEKVTATPVQATPVINIFMGKGEKSVQVVSGSGVLQPLKQDANVKDAKQNLAGPVNAPAPATAQTVSLPQKSDLKISEQKAGDEKRVSQSGLHGGIKLSLADIESLAPRPVKNIKNDSPLNGISFGKADLNFKSGIKGESSVHKTYGVIPPLVLNSLLDAEKLSPVALQEPLPGLLTKLVELEKNFGFHNLIFSLEKSPLYKAYISTGLKILNEQDDFGSLSRKNPTEYLNKEEFEKFTDLLREVQAS